VVATTCGCPAIAVWVAISAESVPKAASSSLGPAGTVAVAAPPAGVNSKPGTGVEPGRVQAVRALMMRMAQTQPNFFFIEYSLLFKGMGADRPAI
jgi:hypothetical protein